MDLLEHEGKDLFARHDIPVPDRVLYTGEDVALPAGDRLVVKAQVPAGKRKQHGGIVIADREDAIDEADDMLGGEVAGEPVDAVLIESFVDIEQEYYLSLSVNRDDKAYTLIYSEQGGSGIEEIAEEHPDAVHRATVYRKKDVRDYLLQWASHDAVVDVGEQVYEVLREEDALLVEINPLVVTPDGVMATDAKVRLDENGFYRHDFAFERDAKQGLEQEAEEKGLEFVELDGNVAVIGNGAGLVMATLDSIHHFGGEPANFLDIGGGADMERMRDAMRIALNQDVSGLFVNIFGGITRCDEVAQGIISFVDEEDVDLPMVVRMVGTNQQEGKQLLEDNGIHALDSMDACAEKIVELVEG